MTEAPPRILQPLFSQFGCPRGGLGGIAGRFMTLNTYDDEWVADLLDLQPDDRVLEIGFGPGVAIGILALRAAWVAGVDPSDVMLHQARRRNARAIEAGRVELRIGSAERLPYPDASFSKVMALHSLYFWPSVEQGASEITRVLRPGGRVAIGVRMRSARGGVFNPSRYGMTDQDIEHVCAALRQAGLVDVTRHQRDFPRELLTVVLASKP